MKHIRIPWPDLIAVIVVIGITAAILVPIFMPAKARDPRTTCITNVKQLALAMVIYSTDYDDLFPDRDHWMDSLQPYTRNTFLEHCEKVVGSGLYGYAFNAGLHNLTKVAKPGIEPMIYDSVNIGKNASDMFTSLPRPGRHDGKNSIAYADGHAKAVEALP